MPKLTFSLYEETVAALRKAARRTRKPQSLIVGEAIAHDTAREERLALAERERLLTVVRAIRARPHDRPRKDVDKEFQQIRQSRRTGWSRPLR